MIRPCFEVGRHVPVCLLLGAGEFVLRTGNGSNNETWSMTVVEQIECIFEDRGDEKYGSENVTQRQHALQCAALAEAADAPKTLVAAALLHDIGHLLTGDRLPESMDENFDDSHEDLGAEWLEKHFSRAVTAPVRLHVAAKRYLCTKEPGYLAKLSPTSKKSYEDQGGQMSGEELAAFESDDYFEQGLELRRWDDAGKDASLTTKSVAEYREVLCELVQQ